MSVSTDVSVVIVNYHTYSLLEACIKSIFKYTEGLDFEVIVVDNHSDSELTTKLDLVFPGKVVVVQLSENVGFGRANNEGFKIATGKYVFCLNPDTLLLNNAIKILYDYLEQHPSVGVCGGNLFDSEMNPTHSYRMALPSLWWEMDWHLGCFFGMLIWGINLEFNHTDKPRRVGYITGADMMIRKEIINQVGGFSKYFFMYYEECEFTYRIRKQGYDVFSVPAARIQHLEGKSFPSSELTTKTKYQTYSRLMYHRLCSPIVYRLLALYAKLCSKMPVQKSAYLDYKVNVFRQIDRNVK